MNCKRCRSRMEEWLDGEMEPAAASAVQTHIDNCPECARLLDERRSMARSLRNAAIRTSSHLRYIPGPVMHETAPAGPGHRLLRVSGLATAACLVLAAGVLLFFPQWLGHSPQAPEKGVTAEIHIRDTLHNREDAFITGNDRGTRFRIHVQVEVEKANGHPG